MSENEERVEIELEEGRGTAGEIHASEKDESWIPILFKKRECTTFVEDSSSNGTRCQCGRQRDSHQPVALEESMATHWDSAQHSSEHPTDAFGWLWFEGVSRWRRSYMPVLRLSWDTNPSMVYDLMTRDRSKNGWGLSTPNLVVSVVGGEGSAEVSAWVQEVLRQGLVKALRRTGAWIVTEGLCEGVGRCVGEAVRDFNIAASSDFHNKVVALGVAPWGLVHNRQQLVNPQGISTRCTPTVKYSVEKTTGDSCCLDNSYEAFLLVDDGSVGRRGGEAIFRVRLEDCISHQPTGIKGSGSGSIAIPVLCMLISGQPTMLEWLDASLRNSAPWLVLAGSGGVADLLSDILENLSPPVPALQTSSNVGDGDACPSVDLKDRVAELVMRHFPAEAQTDTLIEQALSIYQNRDMITIYHGKQERPDDFDTVLLKALARAANKQHASYDARLHTEDLKLLNRVDIAKSEFFNGDINWMNQDLEECMTEALVNDKPHFVRLFTENGFSVQDYLTYGRLENLYGSVAQGTLAYRLLVERLKERKKTSGYAQTRDISLLMECAKEPSERLKTRREISLYELSGVLRQLLGKERPFYFRALGLEDNFTYGRKSLRHASKLLRGDCSYRKQPCESPWTSLLIWAVLQNRSDMAVFFWEMAEDSVLSALSACKMLREMSKMDCETETKLSMAELAQRFEKLAHDVFSSFYQSSHSFKLLTCDSPVWGTNCLQMGMAADARLFFSHDGVQAKLSKIWLGSMERDTTMWKVLLTLLCPGLCYTNLITFRFRILYSRWHQFWSAPVTAFVGNVLMYFLFLLLFAYVLLVDFKLPPPSGLPAISEYLLYFWVFTFICEEIRQAFFEDNMTFHQSMRLYRQDVWNKCDLTAIILFIIGLVCRMFERSYEFGRCVLCIDYMVFTLRLIHISAAHKEMGPKIIIVGKMMKDVSFFLFFLGVWLMAYGVANQALLYYYDPSPNRIFRRVFYRPYLHIFGHFPVEEVDVGEQWDLACTDNVTLIEGGAEPCRSEYSNWLVIILLVIFLLVTNILLINLLIAILSYTFEKVQEKSDIYWRFQRYKLILEYKSRPALAPPFIILSHLHLFLSFLKRKIYRVAPGPIYHSELEIRRNERERIMRWESDQKRSLLAAQRESQRDSDSERIKHMADKVDSVLKQATESRDFDQRLKQISDKVDRVDGVLKQLTEQLNESRHMKTEMEKSLNALNQILNTLARSTLENPGQPPGTF